MFTRRGTVITKVYQELTKSDFVVTKVDRECTKSKMTESWAEMTSKSISWNQSRVISGAEEFIQHYSVLRQWTSAIPYQALNCACSHALLRLVCRWELLEPTRLPTGCRHTWRGAAARLASRRHGGTMTDWINITSAVWKFFGTNCSAIMKFVACWWRQETILTADHFRLDSFAFALAGTPGNLCELQASEYEKFLLFFSAFLSLLPNFRRKFLLTIYRKKSPN